MGSVRKGRDSPNDYPQKKMKTLNENRSKGARWQVCGRPCRIAVKGGRRGLPSTGLKGQLGAMLWLP